MEEESREVELLRQVLKRLDEMDNRLIHIERHSVRAERTEELDPYEIFIVRGHPAIKLIYRHRGSAILPSVADHLSELMIRDFTAYNHFTPSREFNIVLVYARTARYAGVPMPTMEQMPGYRILVFIFPSGHMPEESTEERRLLYPDFQHVFFLELEKSTKRLDRLDMEYRALVDVILAANNVGLRD